MLYGDWFLTFGAYLPLEPLDPFEPFKPLNPGRRRPTPKRPLEVYPKVASKETIELTE